MLDVIDGQEKLTLESLNEDNAAYDYGQSRSVAVGAYALHLSQDRAEVYNGNVAVGHSAGYKGGADMAFAGNVYVGNSAGHWHDAGGSVFVGQNAGYNYMSGSYNVGIGRYTMRGFATSSATGNYNVAIGSEAGYNWTNGFNSSVIGYRAGYEGAGYRDMTLIGAYAGYNMSGSQQYNTYIGSSAGYGKSLASGNVAVGYNAIGGTDWRDNLSSVNGDYSGLTAVGYRAGIYVASGFATLMGTNAGEYAAGSSNQFFGYYTGRGYVNAAPYNNGHNNVGIGREALEGFRSGSYNTAIGRDAMTNQQDGDSNVAIGYASLYGSATALYNSTDYNIGIGHGAMYYHGQGDHNVAMGYYSLSRNVSGSANIAIGREAGHYATGSNNTFIGYYAGYGSSGAPFASGENNTAIGYQSLLGFTTAAESTVIGYQSGKAITSGIRNVLVGAYSGDAMTTTADTVLIGTSAGGAINSTDADGTVAIGYQAGLSITSGQSSTLVGYLAGHKVTIGDSNTAIGYKSLGGNTSSALGVGGNSNVAVGYHALSVAYDNCSKNVAVGNQSLESVTNGKNNTGLGAYAGDNLTTGLNNTYVGYYALPSAVDVNDEILIKAGSGTSMTGGGTETVRIGVETDYITNDFGENATWTHSSDRRVKKNIEDNDLGLGFIEKLRTRKFQKKAPSEYPEEFDQHNPNTTERKNPDRIHYGFVAQEVKEAMDSIGHSEFPVWKENTDGMQELGETELITPLVKAVQELSSENKELKEELNELKIFINKKLGDE